MAKTQASAGSPNRQFNINQVWLELTLTGLDLIAWIQILLLDGELAQAEPKKLRYRLLHTAARIVYTGRRILLRINASWPWAADLAPSLPPPEQPATTSDLTRTPTNPTTVKSIPTEEAHQCFS